MSDSRSMPTAGMPTLAAGSVMMALILATLGCTGTGSHTPAAASAPRVASAALAPPQHGERMYTVSVSSTQPAYIAAESLSIELLSVKDDRCPEGVSCIWAGHAAVTLQISKPGMATQTITVGSEAPPQMRLPYDAAYENYALHLAKLEPGNTQSPAAAYRATLTVRAGLSKATLPQPAQSEM